MPKALSTQRVHRLPHMTGAALRAQDITNMRMAQAVARASLVFSCVIGVMFLVAGAPSAFGLSQQSFRALRAAALVCYGTSAVYVYLAAKHYLASKSSHRLARRCTSVCLFFSLVAGSIFAFLDAISVQAPIAFVAVVFFLPSLYCLHPVVSALYCLVASAAYLSCLLAAVPLSLAQAALIVCLGLVSWAASFVRFKSFIAQVAALDEGEDVGSSLSKEEQDSSLDTSPEVQGDFEPQSSNLIVEQHEARKSTTVADVLPFYPAADSTATDTEDELVDNVQVADQDQSVLHEPSVQESTRVAVVYQMVHACLDNTPEFCLLTIDDCEGKHDEMASLSQLLAAYEDWYELCQQAQELPQSCVVPLRFTAQNFEEHIRSFEEALHQLEDRNISLEQMNLLVSESDVAALDGSARALLRRLRSLGLPLWLGDFGSGTLSLNLLATGAFDALTLDSSLVEAAVQDEVAQALVLHLIDLSHELSLYCVGVVKHEQAVADMLEQLGCDAYVGDAIEAALSADLLRQSQKD